MKNQIRPNLQSEKALFGMTLVLLGIVLLLRSLDILFISSWVISWPVFLIVIGVVIGKRKGFNKPVAFMPIIIGVIFIFGEINPDFDSDRLFWPAMIITLGFWLILGRRKQFQIEEKPNPIILDPINTEAIQDPVNQGNTNKSSYLGDRIDSTSIFGGIKKNVVSKNFQGGDILNFFGGTEINLLQADIQGIVKINVVQIFGGTKIIVPANWVVQSEMIAIMGGIEDKRPPQLNASTDKILLIQGTSVFAGIDIKSY
jgi:predicted membrane protein